LSEQTSDLGCIQVEEMRHREAEHVIKCLTHQYIERGEQRGFPPRSASYNFGVEKHVWDISQVHTNNEASSRSDFSGQLTHTLIKGGHFNTARKKNRSK
jgi:hypothetical protein